MLGRGIYYNVALPVVRETLLSSFDKSRRVVIANFRAMFV